MKDEGGTEGKKLKYGRGGLKKRVKGRQPSPPIASKNGEEVKKKNRVIR